MMRFAHALLILWLSLPLSGWAIEVELGQRFDGLDNGYADWRSTYLEGVEKNAAGQTLYGVVNRTERFALDDQELLAGLYQPIDNRWKVLAEGSFSPSHRVLPHWSALLQMEAALSQGWGFHLGIRHTRYENGGVTDINRANLTLERYAGNLRAAYTFYSNQITGGGSPTSHALQLGYYYGERNSLGVTIASGSEVMNQPPAPPAYYDVRSVVLSGRYWFAPQWALTHEIGLFEQGDLYTRKGVQIGIRRLF